MQNDHLADAILFLRSALSCFAEGYPVSRYDIERAIREIEAEIESRSVAPPPVSRPKLADTTELCKDIAAIAGTIDDKRTREKIYKTVRQLQLLEGWVFPNEDRGVE